MTTITITDPVLLKQLGEAKGTIELLDPAGKVLLTAATEFLWAPPDGYVPPIPAEELDRRSATCRSGVPHAEVMKRLRSLQ